jgi:two-component system, chemotaxis family, response regulator Rcp1
VQKSILSAEDDEGAQHLLELALGEIVPEFRLYKVKHGAEALQFLNRAEPFTGVPEPDLVLLDLNMPRMDGLDVLREIRKDEGLRKIPVIIISSSRLASDSKRCLALGAKDFITKSASYAEFVSDLKRACGFIDGDALAATIR